jgi:hypothetical protein
MAPAQSTLNGRKPAGTRGASTTPRTTNPKPPPVSVSASTPASAKKRSASIDLLGDDDEEEESLPITEVIVNGDSKPAAASPMAPGADVGSVGHSSASTSAVASTQAKADKYAELRKTLRQHKTPRSAKKQRKQKRTLPKPGDGKVNKMYTTKTADGSVIVFCMHKRKAGEHAFTKNIDDVLNANPNVRETMGIDNMFLRVHPDNGNEPWGIEYVNKDKETKTKYATIYHRKPSTESTMAKREKWARMTLIKHFNKYGSVQYSQRDWGAEKFEYGGDLETTKWTDYLADYITNASVASVMKEDFGHGEKPLKCEDMAKNDMLVEMYYGPDKMEEGKLALLTLAKGNTFTTGESDVESDGKPYESEDEEPCVVTGNDPEQSH